MSYQNDLFVDNCVMRLVQIAVAIRQNNDRLTCQELDSMAREFDAEVESTKEEVECQEIDACEVE